MAIVATPDRCHTPSTPHARSAAVFLGRLESTRRDEETGYAHSFMWYAFRPIVAWRGGATDDLQHAVSFIPTADDVPSSASHAYAKGSSHSSP